MLQKNKKFKNKTNTSLITKTYKKHEVKMIVKKRVKRSTEFSKLRFLCLFMCECVCVFLLKLLTFEGFW